LELIVGHESAQQLHPLLNPVLPFDFSDTSFTAALDNQGKLVKTLDLFHNIIMKFRNEERAILIILEDIQWCDNLSWQLMMKCSRSAKCGVVLSSRPDIGKQSASAVPFKPVTKTGATHQMSIEEVAARDRANSKESEDIEGISRSRIEESFREVYSLSDIKHGFVSADNNNVSRSNRDEADNESEKRKTFDSKKKKPASLIKITLGALHTEALREHLAILLDVTGVSRELIELIEQKSEVPSERSLARSEAASRENENLRTPRRGHHMR